MTDSDICAVVLAAGEGRRLRPLTEHVPKALCPVGNVPLLDLALDHVERVGFTGPARVAVNAWYLADQITAHVRGRTHISVETGPVPYGSAGALAALRGWVDGRHVLVGNADAYLSAADDDPVLDDLLTGWDRDHVRLLGVEAGDRTAEFGPYRFAGFSLIPWRIVAALPTEPADLVRAVWRPAEHAGDLRIVEHRGDYLDSGTPHDYLTANLHAAAASSDADPTGSLVAKDADVTGDVVRSVVGARAEVRGTVDRCVIWPEATVARGEHLTGVIRYGRCGTVATGTRTTVPPIRAHG